MTTLSKIHVIPMILIELMRLSVSQGFIKEPVSSMMTRKLIPMSPRKWNTQERILRTGEKHLQKQGKDLMIKEQKLLSKHIF